MARKEVCLAGEDKPVKWIGNIVIIVGLIWASYHAYILFYVSVLGMTYAPYGFGVLFTLPAIVASLLIDIAIIIIGLVLRRKSCNIYKRFAK